MSAPDLTPDEMGEVARFGIHDPETETVESPWDPITPEAATEKPDTVPVETFMASKGISRAEMCALLREYRSETGYSPYEWGPRDVLDSQFLSWHEWERLG